MNCTPKIIDIIVKNDLCIGCGLCTYQCPSKALEMKWNEYGFLTPNLMGTCDNDGSCISVCPFNPFPIEEVKTEDELATIFLNDASMHHPKIGKYSSLHIGYSNEYRMTSSSGGIATYILIKLLEMKIIDCVISVKESTNNGIHYEYAISKSKEEITSGSKTKYYPVTLANVFSLIDKIEGSVAIVGVGCFIKAIRLAQYSNPILKNKIKFLVGIICGGVKSSFFSQYLASKAGVQATAYSNPEFRVKDINSTASDYSFRCFDKTKNEYKTIKMRSVGDMWGTGLFKNNACDFCDDVTTELADISLGDAWLPAYDNDGKGNSIIISRSALSKRIINEGIDSKELILNSVSSETIISSQQGSFSHRHSGLQYRINKYKKKRKLVPPKRVKQPFFNISFKAVQSLRMLVRYKSLVIWSKFPDAVIFENKIKTPLIWLQKMTHIYHIEKRLRNKIKTFIS